MFTHPSDLEDARERSLMKNLSVEDFNACLKAKNESGKVVVPLLKKSLVPGEKKTQKTECLEFSILSILNILNSLSGSRE